MNNDIKKTIENNILALATVSNKKPYVIAVSCCKILDEDKLLITDNFMNSTIKNIFKNNNVALVTWDKKERELQILGKAKYYNKGKWLKCVKEAKENKGMPAKGAILVKINKIIESK
jgi:uncharacterized pyridoxamine 5'-phosphate oxidase family protein